MRSRPETAPLKPPLGCNASNRIASGCTSGNTLLYRHKRSGVCAACICRRSDVTRLSNHNDKLPTTINFAELNSRRNLF